MNVITTLNDKRREKQWNFERKMLRHIDLKKMERSIKEWVRPLMPFQFQAYPFLLDQSIDMTIDAFLLGTEYGRFGIYGESTIDSKKRCDAELTMLSHSLCDTLSGWNGESPSESLLTAIDMLLGTWWEKGYLEARKAYKLRLQ